MEDSNFDNSSQDLGDLPSHSYNETDYIAPSITAAYVVVMCVIATIGLPLTLVAICAVYSLVRRDHVAPIYVINLLISDLIQLCSMIAFLTKTNHKIASFFYTFGLIVSVGFMVCVALERYLSVACPLWYRFRRTIKIPVTVCVLVWILPPALMFTLTSLLNIESISIVVGIFFVVPLPLFIFFLFGTLRALSASHVPADEKRRVIGILVLVLLVYTLLFLPSSIHFLAAGNIKNYTFMYTSLMFVQFSPLADLCLYIFMRKGIIDKFLASVCCCRMDSNDSSSSPI